MTPQPTDPTPPKLVEEAIFLGRLVANRYRIERRIGGGGASTVWCAFDETLADRVAFKVLDRQGNTERWRREVALARRIAHPNVCRVFDLGETEDFRWVTMELIPGLPLRRMIAKSENDPARLDDVMRQIVSGVAAIHSAGVVHRDLKPENIIVGNDGRVVIVDFGIARDPDSPRVITRAGAVMGTPGYMAPEQALGELVDMRTDVFAMALVLHELATGALPKTFGQTLPGKKHSRVAAEGNALSSPWDALLPRCLELFPKHRFENAVEFEQQLKQLKQHKPAPQPPSVNPQTKPPQRRVRWLTFGMLIGLIGLVGLAVLLARASDAPDAPGPQSTDNAATDVRPPKSFAQQRLTNSAVDSQPSSVALSVDGDRVAYTVGNELRVRRRVGTKWVPTTDAIQLPRSVSGRLLARRTNVIGFFGDGLSLAISTVNRRNEWSLWRVGKDEPELLVESAASLVAALAKDGSALAVGMADGGLEIVPLNGEPSYRVEMADQGGPVSALAWNNDGSRLALGRRGRFGTLPSIEVVGRQGEDSKVLWRSSSPRESIPTLLWDPSGESVLFASNNASVASWGRIDVESADKTLLASWDHQTVLDTSSSNSHLAMIRGGTRRSIQVASIYQKYGTIASLKPAVQDQALERLVGWAKSGRFVYSVRSGSGSELIASSTSGEGESLVKTNQPLVADTIDSDAVYFWRGLGDKRALWRAPFGGKLIDIGAANKLRVASKQQALGVRLVRCRPVGPCALEVVENRRAHYHVLGSDGVLGKRLRSRTLTRSQRAFAVADQGSAIAFVNGGELLDRVNLADGSHGTTQLDGAELQDITWAHDSSSLLIMAREFQGARFALLRQGADGKVRRLKDSDHRHFVAAYESRDGENIAVEVVDEQVEVWISPL